MKLKYTMKRKTCYSTDSTVRKTRPDLLNTLINKLPAELHIPGYNFYKTETQVKEPLSRGDTDINLLDEASKLH